MITPKVKDILNIIESHAPLADAEDWDNSGLQVGDLEAEARIIGVALDPTLDAVHEAVRRGANLLLTHHPLIFPNIESIDLGYLPGKVVQLAIKNDLSISCAHTNFDHAHEGTNLALAEAIGLKSPRPLFSKDEKNGDVEKGDGIVYLGELPSPTKLSEFSLNVKESLDASIVRFVGDKDLVISSVAVSGGSGSDYILDAAKMGAQVFVTGEIKYHMALAAIDYRIGVVEAGHFYTEMPAVFEMANIIRKESSENGWDVDIFTIKGNDPFSIVGL